MRAPGCRCRMMPLQRAAVQRDQRDVLQRPAHPRRGEAERGGLRQADELLGRHKCRDLLADAEMKGIAARQNHDGAPAMALDLGERVADRARPGEPSAANQARSANSRWRAPPTTSSAAPISWRATAESPSTPSSPMPTMDSQRCAVQVAGSAVMEQVPMRVLILGGTTEASELARLLAADRRFETTLSLAGRTANPRPQPVTTRTRRLRRRRRTCRMAAAGTHRGRDRRDASLRRSDLGQCGRCMRSGLRCRSRSIVRPAWQAEPGDNWLAVAKRRSRRRCAWRRSRAGLSQPRPHGTRRLRGRIRSIIMSRAPSTRPSVALPPDIRLILDRGPFDRQPRRALLEHEKIDVVVSKNSGGVATYAKIDGRARAWHSRRDDRAPAQSRTDSRSTMPMTRWSWLEQQLAHRAASGSARGV